MVLNRLQVLTSGMSSTKPSILRSNIGFLSDGI